MRYRLKSNLSKTAVYRAVCAHNTSGVELPPIRQCQFRKVRHAYWLSFPGYEVLFCQWDGDIRFKVDAISYDEELRCIASTEICKIIPFDYCLQNNLLREVA